MRLAPLALATTLCLGALPAWADVATIKKAIEPLVGRQRIEEVRPAGVGGLWEVRLAGDMLVYTDARGSFLMRGELFDVKGKRNITELRMRELSSTPIDFSVLPLANAVKTVRGNGKTVIATWEDPNCGFCKQLFRELNQMTDITIYTFLLPVLAQDSVVKSKQIWCAADRSKAWAEWMLENKAPTGAGDCETPIASNQELGRKLNINGTPQIFLADGSRFPGFMSAAELKREIAARENAPAAKKPAAKK